MCQYTIITIVRNTDDTKMYYVIKSNVKLYRHKFLSLKTGGWPFERTKVGSSRYFICCTLNGTRKSHNEWVHQQSISYCFLSQVHFRDFRFWTALDGWPASVTSLGEFRKFWATFFLKKVAQIFHWFGAIYKNITFQLNPNVDIFGQPFWIFFGYFSFHHLVTLNGRFRRMPYDILCSINVWNGRNFFPTFLYLNMLMQ